MDTLKDNVDYAKSASFCNLAADRGDVYIIKGYKNLIAFITLLFIQK